MSTFTPYTHPYHLCHCGRLCQNYMTYTYTGTITYPYVPKHRKPGPAQ